jgi:phage-related protein (TIGR01555 family)
MLYDQFGRQVPSDYKPRLQDPVFDPRAESGGYQLPNVRMDHMTPDLRRDLGAEIERTRMDTGRMDAAGAQARAVNLDAFANELTGLGTVWGDKTKGGLPGGPVFLLHRIRGPEAEARTRGSDLGANIVNKTPDEMTREGWAIDVQPTEDDAQAVADPRALMDACRREPRRAAAAWRNEARRRHRKDAVHCYAIARRWDALPPAPAGAPPPPMPAGVPLPPTPPAALPKLNDEGIEIGLAMEKWGDRVSIERVFNQALKYERLVGGGAVFIGVQDGVDDLTQPLDVSKVRKVTHLTPFTGGWDGEVVMWRPYNDPRHEKYGQPEIYQVRNLSVSLARPPAPGETRPPSQLIPMGPSGPTIFYVHESRFIVFNGDPVTRQAEQEMRGWGDSVYTRVNEVLSQFDQTWNAVAVLMQEFSILNMAIDGYSQLLASRKPEDREILLQRARDLQLLRSVARMNVYDAKDKVERMNVSIAGVPELLDGPLARRLAAAADMPVSLLFGQVKGALGGDAGDTETRYFYDQVRAKIMRKLVPGLTKLYDLVFHSSEGPTRGVVPERWSVQPRPLWQMTPLEKAQLRLTTAQADQIEINDGVATAAEVTATRYGGADYNPGPIVLDIEGREEASAREQLAAPPRTPPPGASDLHEAPPAGPGTPPLPEAVSQEIYPKAPAIAAMPADPLTGDPTAVPSTISQTGAGGKPLPAREQTEGDDDRAKG